MGYKKKEQLFCFLILICISYSVTTDFKLPHENFMRCTHQYCLFSVIQISPFVLAMTLY